MKSEIHQISLSDIAVVIAARNEERTIGLCMQSVLAAAKREAEVWAVDDGSTDRTQEILRSFEPQVRMLQEVGKGPAHARNLALKQITRNYVAFTDADAKVAPDWLERLASGLNGKSLDYVSIGGPQKIAEEAEEGEKRIARFLNSISYVSDYLHTGSEPKEVNHNPTVNVLYWKKALELVGGFDEKLWPTEDLDLDLELKSRGKKALFTPLAIVEHRRPRSLWGLSKMMKRYGMAHSHLVKKRGLCQRIHLLPLFLPVFLGLCFFSPRLGVKAAAVCFVLIVLISRGRPILLFATLLSWLFGFYSGLIRKRDIAHA